MNELNKLRKFLHLTELIDKMISEIPEEVLKDPNSTFIDNCAGDGILFSSITQSS